MRAYLIVVFHVRKQHVTKMPFAQDDDMINAFPADSILLSSEIGGHKRKWQVTRRFETSANGGFAARTQ
jgi:hypothetical protein